MDRIKVTIRIGHILYENGSRNGAWDGAQAQWLENLPSPTQIDDLSVAQPSAYLPPTSERCSAMRIMPLCSTISSLCRMLASSSPAPAVFERFDGQLLERVNVAGFV